MRLALPIVLAAACASDAAPGGPWTGRGAAGDRDVDALVVIRARDAVTLDPRLADDHHTVEVVSLLFDGLTRLGADGTVAPALATRWERVDDGRRWRFALRRNVRFHDGTPVTAIAVVASLSRAVAEQSSWSAGLSDARFDAVGPDTVEVIATSPVIDLPERLADVHASVVGPVPADDARAVTAPPGTGRYRLERWEPGVRLTLRRNNDAWDRSARATRLVFEVEADARQRLGALESGAADVAADLPTEERRYAALHPGLRVAEVAPLIEIGLSVGSGVAPFTEPRLRQAVALALGHDALRAYAWGEVARAPLDEDAHSDRARAEALVAESIADGVPTRTPIGVEVDPAAAAYVLEPTRLLRGVTASLAAVGLVVELASPELAVAARVTSRARHAGGDWIPLARVSPAYASRADLGPLVFSARSVPDLGALAPR